jgi:hypothetical protein
MSDESSSDTSFTDDSAEEERPKAAPSSSRVLTRGVALSVLVWDDEDD